MLLASAFPTHPPPLLVLVAACLLGAAWRRRPGDGVKLRRSGIAGCCPGCCCGCSLSLLLLHSHLPWIVLRTRCCSGAPVALELQRLSTLDRTIRLVCVPTSWESVAEWMRREGGARKGVLKKAPTPRV